MAISLKSMAAPDSTFVPWGMFYAAIATIYTWLGALSALYVRITWQSAELKSGHEAILREVKAVRGVLDSVLISKLIGNTQATEPPRRRGNGDL